MTRLAGTTFVEFGLSAFSFADPVGSVSAHTHLELEMVFIEAGAMTLEYAGTDQRIDAGELVVYWAGLPHGVTDVRGRFHVAQVPLVEVLAWAGAGTRVDQLLAGRFHREAVARDAAVADRVAFTRWSADLATDDPQLHAIAGLEMQARLRRCLHSTTPASPAGQRPGAPTTAGVAAAIRYVVRHFLEPVTVDDIAGAVGWQRDHLMASFRAVCGLTLWGFVTRVRLAEAQRLLTSTDLPILAVCDRAGFSSTSRMYDAFGRYCDRTPAEYRHATR